MPTERISHRVYQLIELPKQWTKGFNALEEDGFITCIESRSATCFCAQGAIARFKFEHPTFDSEQFFIDCVLWLIAKKKHNPPYFSIALFLTEQEDLKNKPTVMKKELLSSKARTVIIGYNDNPHTKHTDVRKMLVSVTEKYLK
jgi:hypothetical protein